MRSCIFHTLFQMNEINCMIIHENLNQYGEKCGNKGKSAKQARFHRRLEDGCLWKSLWTVCISFCINRKNCVGTGRIRGSGPNFFPGYPVFTRGDGQKYRHGGVCERYGT